MPGSGVKKSGVRSIGGTGNRRLALLGDAFIRSFLAEDWYPGNFLASQNPMQCLKLYYLS